MDNILLSTRHKKILRQAHKIQLVVSAQNADDRDACTYLVEHGYLTYVLDDIVDITQAGEAALSSATRRSILDVLTVIATVLSIVSIVMQII